MTGGMLRRVQRLEERNQAAIPQRVTIICRWEEESETEAIARHGLVPGEQGLVILRRYGATACWCRTSSQA